MSYGKVPKTNGSNRAAGDNYGIGVKNKVGKLRGSTVGYRPVSPEKLKVPPKSVV